MEHAVAIYWADEGRGYGISFGPWNHPDAFCLDGFDTMFDAWAFCIAHDLGDPQAGLPDRNRQWTNKPLPPKLQPDFLEEMAVK